MRMIAQLLVNQMLKRLRAGSAYLQQKAPFADKMMNFLKPRQLGQKRFGLALVAARSRLYEDKRGDGQADCQWINQRRVAFDIPALFQQLDPPQHRGWRKTDTLRQFGVRDPSILL
jgi:hypothetical protein